jgi:hypothetical protein
MLKKEALGFHSSEDVTVHLLSSVDMAEQFGMWAMLQF